MRYQEDFCMRFDNRRLDRRLLPRIYNFVKIYRRQQPDPMEIYEPCVEIASLDSFDSTDGFDSYHITWSFGKLSDMRVYERVYFNAGATLIDKNYASNMHDLKWKLRILGECGTKEKTFIIDILNKDEIGSDIEILHRMPIIARLGIGEKDGRDDVKLLSARVMYGQVEWKFAPDELKDFTRPVYHLWLDVPTSMQDGDRQIENYERPNSGRDLAFSSIAGLFKEVNGKTAGTSDITLITGSQDGPTKTEDQGGSTKSESQDGPTKPTKERRFFCHRAILAARSPVFETMLVNDQFKESGERDVKIEDVDGEAMLPVLKYMYTGECGMIPIEILPKVIHAAEKYNLPELKDECVFRLLTDDAITDDAWIECLRMAEMYNMASFKAVCILALSTNMRLFGDTQVRERVSEQSMRDLMEMATKRDTTTEKKKLTKTWIDGGADSDDTD